MACALPCSTASSMNIALASSLHSTSHGVHILGLTKPYSVLSAAELQGVVSPVDEGEAWGLILSSSEAILAGADVTELPPCCSGMAFATEIRGPSTIEDVCGLRSTYESKGDTGSPEPSIPCT